MTNESNRTDRTGDPPTAATSSLVATFGRVHNNLRVSVTDRCNLSCTSCMPEEVVFMDKRELLSFEEITHCVRVAAPLGIDKVRLTGGEPLLRRDLPRLVRMLCDVPGIKDVGLTTNGILLAEQAQPLFDAGLRRINVSLDTLDPGRFRELTRRDGLERVIEGILAAKAAGFHPVKVNAVAIRGLTEPDVVPRPRPPPRVRAGQRGDPRRQGRRVRPGEGQRRRHPRRDRGRRRPPRPVLPGTRP